MARSRHRVALAKREIPDQLRRVEVTQAEFEESSALSELEICGADLTHLNAANIRCETVRLTKVKLMQSRWLRASVSDTEFQTCDASNMEASHSSMTRVGFLQCKLTGAQFFHTRLADLEYADCRMNFAIFRGSSIRRTVFRDCDLRRATLATRSSTRCNF